MLVVAILLLVTGLPMEALAIWSTSSAENNPVCNETNNQWNPQLVSDGSGGAIIVWSDGRSVDYDIYVQRLDELGSTLWTDNGTAICTAANDQYNPQLVSDGSGGAIILWNDDRIGTQDIYIQRIDTSGSPLWTDNGTAICTAADEQENPQLVSDGSGGAIIAWSDLRIGTHDIYVQRVDASGSPLWTDNGTAICTAADDQKNPQLVSDGSGGAIITWSDSRGGTSDVYTQRVDASGSPLWTDNGTAISTAANEQENPRLVPDGSGGAIIAWSDDRGGVYDIYSQRVDASGSSLWTDNGTAICTAANDQELGSVCDSSGGAIIAWQDYRSGNYDIYAQRVDASGSALWTANGTAICTAPHAWERYPTESISDGLSGAIMAWQDYRSGSDYDLYAQRVNALGSLGAPPDITVSPTTIDFGSVAAGSSSPAQTVTISNDGVQNSLHIGTITLGGASAAEFSMQNDTASGQTIAPGDNATLEVIFSPSFGGAKTASLSIPSDDPDENTVTVSLSGSSPLPPPSYVGGGEGYIHFNIDILGTIKRLTTSYTGRLYKTVEATSPDGMLTVNLPEGTVITGQNGRLLDSMNVAVNDNPPPPPEDTNIIGLTYNFEPDEANFEPPITVTCCYDPETLPEGVAEEDLVLAFYNEATGVWIKLEGTVNTETHTVTALVDHFTDFAILGRVEILPASFSLSDLKVVPAEAAPGEAVTVTIAVANTGGTGGTIELILKINGEDERARNTDVAAGESETINFTVNRREAATYIVDVNGLRGNFTVVAPPPVSKPEPVTTPAPEKKELPPPVIVTPQPPAPPTPAPPQLPTEPEAGTNWLLIGLVTAAAVIVIAFLTVRWIKRRKQD